MPAIPRQGQRPLRPEPVSWDKTMCSTITPPSAGTSYHKAASLVATNGDKILLKTHIIFRRSPNDQVCVSCDLLSKLPCNSREYSSSLDMSAKFSHPTQSHWLLRTSQFSPLSS